jgi:hypothetical protein
MDYSWKKDTIGRYTGSSKQVRYLRHKITWALCMRRDTALEQNYALAYDWYKVCCR